MPTFSPGSSTCGLVVLVFCALCCPCVTASEVQTVSEPGRAFSLYRNSHATAMACLLDLHGLRKPEEADRLLIATAALFAEFCECGMPGKPTAWRVHEGLEKLLELRGCRAGIEEKVRYSVNAEERATFDDYAASIRQDRPVILTFCYDPDATESLARAARRVRDCTSVVGIGFFEAHGRPLLVCHDGLPQGQPQPIDADRVEPTDAGCPTGGLCGQRGTSLYRWDGEYTNLVLTFVGKPIPRPE